MTDGDATSRLQAMRQSYALGGLDESELADTWLAQFVTWIGEAEAAGIREPNAMVLATASPEGQPSARTVLLKGVDDRGFVLYTNRHSRKGRELEANPLASLVFPWIDLQRQVVIRGSVEVLGDEESDAYFATRPRVAQLGAVASPQSEAIAGRAALEALRADAEQRFPEGTDVPRPPHWGGLRVIPDSVEFWQGRSGRLHDRLVYVRGEDGWTIQRLAP